jgi:hypothetical protein
VLMSHIEIEPGANWNPAPPIRDAAMWRPSGLSATPL